MLQFSILLSFFMLTPLMAMENPGKQEESTQEIKLIENDAEAIEMAPLNQKKKILFPRPKKRKKNNKYSCIRKIAGIATIGLIAAGNYADIATIGGSVYTKDVIKAIPFNETFPNNTNKCTYSVGRDPSCNWAYMEYQNRIDCMNLCQSYLNEHPCKDYIIVEMFGKKYKQPAQCSCYTLSKCNETFVYEPSYSSGIASFITRLCSCVTALIYATKECTPNKLYQTCTNCFKKKQRTS